MFTWIASYPKSGNTWARILLTAYYRDSYVDVNDLIVQGDNSLSHYQSASAVPITLLDNREKVWLRMAALLNHSHTHKYRPRYIKTHHANAEIHNVRLIPPSMTRSAVYIVRDPRDVAVSFSRHTGKSVDDIITDMANEKHSIGGAEKEIPHILTSWSYHVKSWGSEELNATLIKYEDMKADPVLALEMLLVAGGVIPNRERAKKAAAACELAKLQAQEETAGFIEASKKAGAFFGQGKGWKNELTPQQAGRIERDHGEIMREVGYTTSLDAAA